MLHRVGVEHRHRCVVGEQDLLREPEKLRGQEFVFAGPKPDMPLKLVSASCKLYSAPVDRVAPKLLRLFSSIPAFHLSLGECDWRESIGFPVSSMIHLECEHKASRSLTVLQRVP